MKSSGSSKEIHLVARPRGEPRQSDFAVVEVAVPDPGPGQVLVHNRFISVDPYMRGRMRDAKSYVPPFALGAVMTGMSVGEGVASQSPDLAAGDIVLHDLGWREYALGTAAAFRRVPANDAPLSAWLGMLGMVGLTAWVGMLEIAALKPGDVVFVSGAAISSMPTQAVKPTMPSMPSQALRGASFAGTRRNAAAVPRAYSRQPRSCRTMSPAARSGDCEATTSPTDRPVITAPSAKGGTYDLASRMRPRMYGSTEMKRLWTRTWPGPGSGTATSTTAKSLCLGSPRGRATRWISLLLPEDFIWDTPERRIATQPSWPVGLMRISLSETRCGWPTAKAIAAAMSSACSAPTES